MMPHEPGDELLEYQTEHESAGAPVEPVPVAVCDPVVTIETVPQHATAYTVVVATDPAVGAPYEQLLPLDPLRVRATVWATTTDAVICHSLGQAQDPANSTTGVPNPAGAYLPTGLPIVIHGGQQMWAAATAATASQISVIVERRDA